MKLAIQLHEYRHIAMYIHTGAALAVRLVRFGPDHFLQMPFATNYIATLLNSVALIQRTSIAILHSYHVIILDYAIVLVLYNCYFIQYFINSFYALPTIHPRPKRQCIRFRPVGFVRGYIHVMKLWIAPFVFMCKRQPGRRDVFR